MGTLMQEMNERALKAGVPLGVQFDVTYRCNERCVHCYLDHDDHGEMTAAEIMDVLDQLAEAGVFFLTFSGGEVLMRMDFFRILEYARSLLFCVKVKTNAFMIREKEADRLRELGVDSVQVSIYSHRPEVHDAITKLPGSLKRSLAGIRLLRERGMKVIIANVLMRQNLQDYPGVVALAKELGAEYTIDPTITPMMDGDRSILGLGISQHGPASGLPHPGTGRQRGGILRSPSRRGRRRPGWPAVQRQPHLLLHFPLRRCLPLRAVPAAHRQRAPAEVPGDLEVLAANERGALHSRPRSAHLLHLLAPGHLHPLPGTGLHGRQHARALHARLRKVLRPHRHSLRQHAGQSRRRPKLFRGLSPGTDHRLAAARRSRLAVRPITSHPPLEPPWRGGMSFSRR